MLVAVYTALTLGANAVSADPALQELRVGEMRNIAIHDKPVAVAKGTITDPAGNTYRLADWQGKVAVVNFWATWCAPCREEMPALDALAADAGDDLAVVTIATGRNLLPAIDKFFAETEIEHLPKLLDPKSVVARPMGVAGLPVTVVLNREGQEVARLIGGADWNSPEARAVLAELAAR